MSRVRTFRFGPGRLEHLELRTWRAPKRDGMVKARMRGEYAIYWPTTPYETDKLVCAAHQDKQQTAEEAAYELMDLMLEAALDGWFDLCNDEHEEEGQTA